MRDRIDYDAIIKGAELGFIRGRQKHLPSMSQHHGYRYK